MSGIRQSLIAELAMQCLANLKQGGIKPLTQNTTQRQTKRDAKIQDEEGKYRLRQFYMILLKADKARLLALEEDKKTDREQRPKAR